MVVQVKDSGTVLNEGTKISIAGHKKVKTKTPKGRGKGSPRKKKKKKDNSKIGQSMGNRKSPTKLPKLGARVKESFVDRALL